LKTLLERIGGGCQPASLNSERKSKTPLSGREGRIWGKRTEEDQKWGKMFKEAGRLRTLIEEGELLDY